MCTRSWNRYRVWSAWLGSAWSSWASTICSSVSPVSVTVVPSSAAAFHGVKSVASSSPSRWNARCSRSPSER
jgi:hypothetical protein